MPTYQYQCLKCSHKFEEFQKITDPPLEKCPRCGARPRRIITGGAGFLLKGNGFYSTDYRSSSYIEAEKKEKESLSTEKPKDAKKDSATESSDKKATAG